jgi:integrase
VWDKVRDISGIKKEIWDRDLRAAAVTEAREAAAPIDDVAKVAGHTSKRTTAKVYDRDHLEAQRRVARARVAHRGNTDCEQGVS